MIHKLNNTFSLGSTFDDGAEKAKQIANEINKTVEFEFNGINCQVDKNTNLQWLWKDYANAHLMEWKTVTGIGNYDAKTEEELKKRKIALEEKQEITRREGEKKDRLLRKLFTDKVDGIEIELRDIEKWNEFKESNKDPYGACCVEYAESWARLMQLELLKGKKVIECGEKTSHELGFLGITGYMYGCAVFMLSQCWKHGEDLRKWHNKEYKHEGDGVVNPAILTFKKK